MNNQIKGSHLGWKIDGLLSKIGLRFVCFSPYKGELDYLNNDKPVLHTPDIAGNLVCIYCGRLKRIHLASKIKSNMV